MTNALHVLEGGKQSQEVIEVATTQITEHSRLGDYLPPLTTKKWREYVANVAKNGVLIPIFVTKGFRVIGGGHLYRAVIELSIESMDVVIVDIPENEVPSYMANTLLQQAELKKGQKAALVIRLYYDEERQKARERMSLGGKGGINEGTANLQTVDISGESAKILADKSGMSTRNLYYLIAVYRSRSDLFELVFDGTYSINRAYTQMKADEKPDEKPKEESFSVNVKEVIEKAIEDDSNNPQIIEEEPSTSVDNRLIQMRKKSLALRVEALDESEHMKDAKEDVRNSAREQLLSLAKTCVIVLGNTTDDEKDTELLVVINELLNKIGGDQ